MYSRASRPARSLSAARRASCAPTRSDRRACARPHPTPAPRAEMRRAMRTTAAVSSRLLHLLPIVDRDLQRALVFRDFAGRAHFFSDPHAELLDRKFVAAFAHEKNEPEALVIVLREVEIAHGFRFVFSARHDRPLDGRGPADRLPQRIEV